MIQDLEVSCIDSTSRTKNVKLHISLTFLYKALAIGLSYLLIPLTISYLNIEQYGIWMTLLSMVSWIAYFDIGLGNGLRNKLTQALSLNDIKLAKTYISTSYIAIGIISLIFFILFLIVFPFMKWNKIFNTNLIANNELAIAIFFTVFFFLLNFFLSLSNQMFYAYQEASRSSIKIVILNIFLIIAVYILTRVTAGKLLYLSLCYGISETVSNIILIYFFFKKHKDVIPSYKYIDLTKIKEIISLGAKFFIIQMACLIIFATDNMIITQILGPKEVTPYNIIFKLFNITVAHGIILAPLWSAYTEAYEKGDIKWIKNTIKKLNILMIPIIITVLILIIFARDIINIWIGPNIQFSDSLVILMGIYAIISVWNNIYAYFLNGVGKLKLSLIISIFAAIANIPLSIYFAKYCGLGSSGVILGTVFCLIPGFFLGPFQSWYILYKSGNNRGILNEIFS